MTGVPDRLAAALADRYRIERELGQGGMATVYLARDLKHERDVAVKVLRPELAAVLGADRFVVEIKTTAALQHPHILPLFDSGTADGFLYYVMPFIDGETLRTRLDRETQLGIGEAVRIACEVADALDYAHRHGVIHRDIKPENILLHDGRPMVADFGIALAVSAAAGGRMTETGLSLGTPHYMSPEQATAEKDIGNRADIYSLGSVLYEMLAGEPPHVGHSAQQIIMKIIAEEVQPVTRHRKSVPVNVAAAVGQSLEKLPADRFESAKAFADALRDPAFRSSDVEASLPFGGGAISRRAIAGAAAVFVVLLATALGGWLRPPPSPPIIRYGLALPPSQGMLPGTSAPMPAPDGSYIVYIGPGENGDQLWVKRRDRYAPTPLAGTDGAQSFTISPHGDWVGFVVNNQLKKVPAAGGTAVTIVPDKAGNSYGLAWLDDESIVYVRQGGAGLYRVSANGGSSSLVWRSDSLITALPNPLPGGRGIVFMTCTSGCLDIELWAVDLEGKRARMLLPGVPSAEYVETGHLVYSDFDGGMFAVPFDARRLELSGPPVLLGEQIQIYPLVTFRVSHSGTLVFMSGGSGEGRTFDMAWVDRDGRETPVDTAWTFRLTAQANNHGWSLSPDGSRLAIGLATDGNDDVWVKPLPRGAPYRVSFDPAPDVRPRWTADGRFITYLSSREPTGLYRRRADGTGADSLLVEGVFDEGAVAPDNGSILLRLGAIGDAVGGRNIAAVRVGTGGTPAPLLATEFDEEAFALSPDGRWMAYQSDEPGRTEVFVRPYPDVDSGKRQVSSGGGQAPLWSRDGRELFFLSGDDNMMAARVTFGAMLELSEPTVLFRVRDELLLAESKYYTPWDVAADGRFLMARLVGSGEIETGSIIVVENWIEELKAKVKR